MPTFGGWACTSPAVIPALRSAMRKAAGAAPATLRSVILCLCENKYIPAGKEEELLLCLLGGRLILLARLLLREPWVCGSVLRCHQAVGSFVAPGKVWQCDLLVLSTSAFLTL